MNVRIKYSIAATINGVNGSNDAPCTTCALNIISLTPMTETIDDSLITVTNSLPKAGKIFLIACGK